MHKIVYCLCHGFSTEDNPPENSEAKRYGNLEKFINAGQEFAISNNMIILRIDAKYVVNGK